MELFTDCMGVLLGFYWDSIRTLLGNLLNSEQILQGVYKEFYRDSLGIREGILSGSYKESIGNSKGIPKDSTRKSMMNL